MTENTRRTGVRVVVAGVALVIPLLVVVGPAQAEAPQGKVQQGNLVQALSALLRPAPSTPATTTPTKPATTPTPTPTAPAQASTPSQPAPPTTKASVSTISGTLQDGSSGPQVKALEVKLDTLHYFVGPIDESYDGDTMQAVMAFQKVNGMDRTGKVDQSVWSRIQTASDPAPLVSGGAARRVEVDINRQVLFLYQGGKLNKILAVSTGNGADYCEGGSCGTAITPVGDFAIYRQGSGWETGPLGSLYNPQYFKGGYAIHGSLSVPPEPASHGCIRIPMGAAEWFPDQVSVGTPVHVR